MVLHPVSFAGRLVSTLGQRQWGGELLSITTMEIKGATEVLSRGQTFLHPCDADILADCMTAADFRIVDLDEASYYSAVRESSTTLPNHHQVRMFLYYEPSTFDSFFPIDKNSTVTWSSSANTTMLLSRVDCLQHPSCCDGVDVSDGPVLKERPWQLLRGEWERKDGAIEYGAGISQCLWKRFGADSLTTSCKTDMELHQYPSQQHSAETIDAWIQQGHQIAFIWNGIIIMSCLALLIALALVGWKLLRRCLARCGCFTQITRNSATMTKNERKEQLQQQEICFFIASITLGLVNFSFPMVTMFVAGPVAMAALVWLWYFEFKCAIPSCSWTGFQPDEQSYVDPATDEKEAALLSAVNVV